MKEIRASKSFQVCSSKISGEILGEKIVKMTK